jgi:hypothetical protein
MGIEMRLTLNIIFEWSSLYVRVSREFLLPAFHEIYGGGSFDTMFLTLSASDMTRFRERVQKSAGILPSDGPAPAMGRAARLKAIDCASPTGMDFFSGSLKSASSGLGYLKKISAFAELEVERLYNNVRS